jgi:hypothetical protein
MRTLSASSIYAHVVGVVAETDRAHRRQVIGPIEPHRPVAGVGDNVPIGLRREANPLRLGEPGEARCPTSLRDIDNVDRVVAQFGDQQALA